MKQIDCTRLTESEMRTKLTYDKLVYCKPCGLSYSDENLLDILAVLSEAKIVESCESGDVNAKEY